jgi:Pyridine nucleotide-disulphide oxidoreductase
VATGSDPIVPPVPGLRELEGVSGTREATGMKAVPRRLLVLGGGSAGVEIAQVVRRLGGEAGAHRGRRPRATPRACAARRGARRGPFSQGVTVRAAGDVNVLDSFPGGRLGGGRGRAVITASSAMEYAFEGDQLADDHSRRPSVFTSALVEGLATGDADRDQDGWVSLNELYDYVFDRVREQNPQQTPSQPGRGNAG